MRLLATAAGLCLVSSAAVAASDLDVARQALNDGMWESALSAADLAATNASTRSEARLASLEALAGLARDAEIGRRVSAWQDETNECFRFWRARAAVRGGEFARAKELLGEPFSDKALRLSARVLAAYALSATGRKAEALALLPAEAVKGMRGAAAEDAALLRGELLLNDGSLAEARASLRPIADRAKGREARLRAGYLLGFAEMAEEASYTAGVARVRALLRSAPGEKVSVDAARSFADRLLARGDNAGADDEYRRYLEIVPMAATDPDILSRRGRVHFKLGRYLEAAALFARAEQFSTNVAEKARAATGQAEALLADGRFAEAAKSFGRSAEYGGQGAEMARLSEADALERAGDAASARSTYERLLRGGGEWGARAALRLAAMDEREGKIESAIARYRKLIESGGLSGADETEAYLGQGRACYKSYRYDEAAGLFRIVAERNPGISEEMQFLVALCHYGAGKDVEAMAVASSLMSSTTNDAFRADLMLWCAKYEYNHGEYGAARTHFETYADLSPSPLASASALLWAARSSAEMMDYSKAIDFATKAADRASTNREFFVEALLVQGEALMELGRSAEAAQIFSRAAAHSPEGPYVVRASVLKADALYAMGAGDTNCYAEAISTYQSIPNGSGFTPDRRIEVAFKIGRAMEKLRQTAMAMDQYYRNVVIAYAEGESKGFLFGESSRAFFVRAALALADYNEAAGNDRAAASMLEKVAAADVPASDEARRRLDAIRRKGGD